MVVSSWFSHGKKGGAQSDGHDGDSTSHIRLEAPDSGATTQMKFIEEARAEGEEAEKRKASFLSSWSEGLVTGRRADEIWGDVRQSLHETVWGRADQSSDEMIEFLNEVLGENTSDHQTAQARDAILAEGVGTVSELREKITVVADLVNMGVPLPQARKVFGVLQQKGNEEPTEVELQASGKSRTENFCSVEGLVNGSAAQLSFTSAKPAEGVGITTHEGEPQSRFGEQNSKAPEARENTGAASQTSFTEVDISQPMSERPQHFHHTTEDPAHIRGNDGLVELYEEFQEWLQANGVSNAINQLQSERIIDFSAIHSSDFRNEGLQRLGFTHQGAEEVLQEARRRLQEEQAELDYASSRRGNRCLNEAVDAFKDGVGSWNAEAVPAMMRLERAWAGISRSTQLLARHVSSQADDLASARAFGLSFDDSVLSSALRLQTAEGGYLDDTVAKVGYTSGNATAVSISMRPGASIHSFQFLIHSLSKDGVMRFGMIQEIGCDNMEVNGAYKLGDCNRSWALATSGNIIHDGLVHGPVSKQPLKAGDKVTVVYFQQKGRLRFLLNDERVGVLLDQVAGPCIPAVTVGGQTKGLIQIQNYWGY